jgi:hypothetical protein
MEVTSYYPSMTTQDCRHSVNEVVPEWPKHKIYVLRHRDNMDELDGLLQALRYVYAYEQGVPEA